MNFVGKYQIESYLYSVIHITCACAEVHRSVLSHGSKLMLVCLSDTSRLLDGLVTIC